MNKPEKKDMKHTQGKWEIGIRIGKYKAIPANEQEKTALEFINGIEFKALSIGTEKNQQVAIIPLDESNRANARLIVAAPELLDVCKKILDTFDNDCHCGSKFFNGENSAIARIKQAILKVESK